MSQAVGETLTTVREVAHTAEQSAGWAQRVGDAAQSAVAMGADGSAAVSEAIAAMGSVEREVAAINGHIEALVERANSIAEVITTVNDIAGQTNILAVNASIEAVKAGGAGKGFEVVASEIRTLADQSRQATASVRRILDEIQKATAAAVLGGERGLKAVSGANEIVARAGEAIEALSAKLSANAETAAQISASARQQATGMGQIDHAMENVRRVAEENVAAIGEAKQAARHLKDLSTELAGLTEKSGD